VLDARGPEAKPPFLPKARIIDWKATRYGAGMMGRLDDDHEQLKRVLARVGVTQDAAVVVYGAAKDGWGEEGRIWWTLQYLGFRDARILDGGIAQWVKDQQPTATLVEAPIRVDQPPALTFTPNAKLRADWRQIEDARKRGAAQLIDARTLEEYKGAALYDEPRGGRIPGAKHLVWSSVLGDDGKILPRERVLELLKAAAIDPKRPAIVYCTGGVRSSFMLAVLTHYGVQVANYDGSWFDWSNRRNLPVEK
jgi:thiosulfate/3-mercaptopyruvate sulfurtransferase